MRLLYILFYTASLQISAIIIFTTCLLSYAIPIIMRLNHEFYPTKHNFCFSLKIYFLSFYLPALIRRKPPFSGGFSHFTKTTIKTANYLILAAFLATSATFPTLAVNDFSPLVNSASSASPIFSGFTAEQQYGHFVANLLMDC